MPPLQNRDFQILVKPVGARCNLRCAYCYYLPLESAPYPRMPEEVLEAYILQHFETCTTPGVQFSWHGGEPTLYGLDGFRSIAAVQKKYCPKSRRIVNGIQTNGVLLDEDWCQFLAEEKFLVGLSLDGPERFHDRYRLTPKGEPTHFRVMQSYDRLRKHGVSTECLCVVHSGNVRHPLEVYDFFRRMEFPYITFLPLVEPSAEGCVSERTVPPDAWGEFLCAIFDAWLDRDIGRIKVQIFEEATRPAFGLEHTLCIFRKTCGAVPVLDYNGDLYSCDHFVKPEFLLGNILRTPLSALLDSAPQLSFGRAKEKTLPQQCRRCSVLDMCNGGCPRNRIIKTREGGPGLNFLCSGYKRFFTHCRPFVETLADVYRNQMKDF
jgi:uncharacterized protein